MKNYKFNTILRSEAHIIEYAENPTPSLVVAGLETGKDSCPETLLIPSTLTVKLDGKDVELPVTAVAGFSGYDNITDLIISEGVDYICQKSFMACNNLQKVHLPDSLRYIGDKAFASCMNLEEVVFPLNPTYEMLDVIKGLYRGQSYAFESSNWQPSKNNHKWIEYCKRTAKL